MSVTGHVGATLASDRLDVKVKATQRGRAMAKIMVRAGRKLAGLALLFTLSILSTPAFLGTAQAAESASTAPTTQSARRVPPAAPASDTRVIVVGAVVLAIIVGIAAAVLWYASRHRDPLR
ncbi:hypothetical protein [Amycolatopsis taiwanensis]|uniref:hypothetical protein n=1 Tax=Amycolatopsis taiwanensis TaxID=342230 RepID=UPI00047FF5BB|nr:hypothetical protein [Amycolatopsis taiwanensis]